MAARARASLVLGVKVHSAARAAARAVASADARPARPAESLNGLGCGHVGQGGRDGGVCV